MRTNTTRSVITRHREPARRQSRAVSGVDQSNVTTRYAMPPPTNRISTCRKVKCHKKVSWVSKWTGTLCIGQTPYGVGVGGGTGVVLMNETMLCNTVAIRGAPTKMNIPTSRVAAAILTNATRCSLPNDIMRVIAKIATQMAIKAAPMSCNNVTRLLVHVVSSGNDIHYLYCRVEGHYPLAAFLIYPSSV